MASARSLPPALFARGDLAGAERGCLHMLKRDPNHVPALHLLGLIAIRRGRYDEALRRLRMAAERAPADVGVLEALAEAHRRKGHELEAERTIRLALRMAPTRPTALNVLGMIQLDAGAPEEAARTFMQAVRQSPEGIEPLLNLTVAMNRIGEYERALALTERIDSITPGAPLNLINRGQALKGLGRLTEAAHAFEAAGDLPMARFNLGYVHMLAGDRARGLPLLEARREALGLDRGRRRPAWRGEQAASSTLLVVSEQGLGDSLLMSRFYHAALERVGKLVVEAPVTLHRVLGTIDRHITFVAPGESAAHDIWCPHMSLALLAGDSDTAPADAPWIRVHAEPETRQRPRVGINWAGNPRFAQDRTRSASLETFAALLAVREVEWVSLHLGARAHEADAFGLPRPLDRAGDFFDTARVIAGLDLVVSTETAVPNLSGAMGIPTIVLASTECDWRWRGWYPRVRVCRQPHPGDWPAVVREATGMIREMVSTWQPQGAIPRAA